MKTKNIVFLCLIGLLFASSSLATVVTSPSQKFFEEETAIVEPGVLPNSFWYWADIFSEELQFVFTVGKENKANLLLDIAEERLAEMKVLSEQGVTKYAERLTTKHEESINKAKDFAEEVREDGWEKVQEQQTALEKEIYQQEKQVKKEIVNAPGEYYEKRDGFIGSITSGFREVLSHLKWKKGEIAEQEAEMSE